jgi:phosphohistidine phosphatase
MKIIILVRHGKSSWEDDVTDRQRTLKPRGERDAKVVANQFMKQNEVSQNMFSSPAKRAVNTSKIFTETFGLSEKNVTIDECLYDFGGESVLNFIKNLPNSYNDIMIFGHNHAFTSISNIFGSIFIDNLPTSGLVKMSFNIDNWKDIKKGQTELILIPSELK